jgi:hypothetical protein
LFNPDGVNLHAMPKMPASWAPEPETKGGNLKGLLLLALTVAILTFCSALLIH